MALRDILLKDLGDPPIYEGYRVDLSGLDTLIWGYVIHGPEIPFEPGAVKTYHFEDFEE